MCHLFPPSKEPPILSMDAALFVYFAHLAVTYLRSKHAALTRTRAQELAARVLKQEADDKSAPTLPATGIVLQRADLPPIEHDILLRAARGERTPRMPAWAMASRVEGLGLIVMRVRFYLRLLSAAPGRALPSRVPGAAQDGRLLHDVPDAAPRDRADAPAPAPLQGHPRRGRHLLRHPHRPPGGAAAGRRRGA